MVWYGIMLSIIGSMYWCIGMPQNLNFIMRFKLLVLRSHDFVWFLICCQRIFIAWHVFMGLAPPYPRAKEEFCEAGFECVPASSGNLPQEVTSAADGKNLTNASETQLPKETVNALNKAHKNISAKPPSLRGMRIGHIGGIGHPFRPGPIRPYRPIHPYYHPWRPYRPYARPWLYSRVWGNAITCPCGSLALFLSQAGSVGFDVYVLDSMCSIFVPGPVYVTLIYSYCLYISYIVYLLFVYLGVWVCVSYSSASECFWCMGLHLRAQQRYLLSMGIPLCSWKEGMQWSVAMHSMCLSHCLKCWSSFEKSRTSFTVRRFCLLRRLWFQFEGCRVSQAFVWSVTSCDSRIEPVSFGLSWSQSSRSLITESLYRCKEESKLKHSPNLRIGTTTVPLWISLVNWSWRLWTWSLSIVLWNSTSKKKKRVKIPRVAA